MSEIRSVLNDMYVDDCPTTSAVRAFSSFRSAVFNLIRREVPSNVCATSPVREKKLDSSVPSLYALFCNTMCEGWNDFELIVSSNLITMVSPVRSSANDTMFGAIVSGTKEVTAADKDGCTS